jgi:nucleoside-diphosphate-sugar epimerase
LTAVEKTVLLTGATGFLGGALAAHLLATRPEVRLVVLARPAADRGARERVLGSVARFGDPPGAGFAARIEVISGDLGETATLAKVPFASVTHVVHAAVEASGSPRARAVNVEATLALARRALGGGRLERFVYVGSAWTCGAGARGVVREDDAPRGEPVSDYLPHKLDAERGLEAIAGLPLTIARPSLVVGHTTLGCEPSASLFWILRLLDAVGEIPWEKSRRLDVVPVDWVAAALAHLLFAGSLEHRRYHLSAGPGASVSWADIESAFGPAAGRSPWREAPGTSLAAFASRVASLPRIGAAIPRETLLACLRFLAGDAVFDATRARERGIPAAPPLTGHLPICLRRAGDRTVAEQAVDDQA